MARPRKPPRLFLTKAQPGRPSRWIILDGMQRVPTHCGEHDQLGAQRAFVKFLESRTAPPVGSQVASTRARDVSIGDVLIGYLAARGDYVARPAELRSRVSRLMGFWGDKKLASVTTISCHEYVKARGTVQQARRELQDLRAAINLAIRDGRCREQVFVTTPPKGPPRTRYLTHHEAAKLIWTAYRFQRVQAPKCDVPVPVNEGEGFCCSMCKNWFEEASFPILNRFTRRRSYRCIACKRGTQNRRHAELHPHAPTYSSRHVARYIVTCLYTGSRSSRVYQASFEPEPGRPYVDLDSGLFYRTPPGTLAPKNKQAPPQRLPIGLLGHMRRWRALGAKYVCEFHGRPVNPKAAFARIVDRAGMDQSVVGHTFRHTAATWLMQAGGDIYQVAAYLGMTTEILQSTYGHHHPDFQKDVVALFNNRSRRLR